MNFYGGMTPGEQRVYIRWWWLLFGAIIVLAFLNYKLAWLPAVGILMLRNAIESYFKWRRRAFIRKFEKPGYITRKPGETDGELIERIGKFLKTSAGGRA